MKFQPLAGGRKIRLIEEYVEPTPIGDIKIPIGFETDGASIPRPLWPIFGPPIAGPYLRAAVVHDWLCDEAVRNNDYSARLLSDAVFFFILYRTPGVPKWKRTIMYLFVRCWGKLRYKKVKQLKSI